MRKLASIQKVWAIEPIEGADRIELAHVLGWQCVVNKGKFAVGDLGIYFEVDSFLPIRSEFEFLRASSYKNNVILGEGFRLKTMTFRGQLSQGLLLPVSEFPELQHAIELGADVTDILGVRKWEVIERATTGGTIIGTLPYSIPHTDETRIQAEPGLLDEFSGLEYYITTKMDGSSHSVSIDEKGFHVTGHNYEYKDDGVNSFYEYIKQIDLENKIRAFIEQNHLDIFAIQGELCAPGIQQNRLRLTKPEWYVFTVIENGKRTDLNRLQEVCRLLELKTVCVEEVGADLPSKYLTIDALLARAEGSYPKGGPKEGIVIRPIEPVYCELINGYLSMKVINNKYLLKHE